MRRRFFLATIGAAPLLMFPALTARAVAERSAKAKKGGHPPSIGIAFGGGSVHGMAHLGVLKAFAEKGIGFDFIAGTSAGAIVGVLAAAKLPYVEIDRLARGIDWPGVSDLAWSGKGLMQHTKLQTMIDAAVGNRKLEQLPIPFAAVATDVATGERVVLRKGPAGMAVSASCSIPVLFAPVRIDGRDLVDGGLTEPVPVIAAREMGADLIIGVDVAFRPSEDQFQGLTGAAFQTMHIMGNALIKEQMPHADIAIRMNVHRFINIDKSQDQLIAAGYAATMQAWSGLVSKLRR
ncbi:MAG: patatin-like phospholipase family protein [Betaproteobacteria bacterium]|nr:patatin-like phospholipase family protein [Betaproteobacteria bacterium]